MSMQADALILLTAVPEPRETEAAKWVLEAAHILRQVAHPSFEADQRDAARLAFVIRTDVHLFPNAGPISGAGLFCIYRRKGEEWVNVSGDHADPRKAIDAAMSAQSDTEESK